MLQGYVSKTHFDNVKFSVVVLQVSKGFPKVMSRKHVLTM